MQNTSGKWRIVTRNPNVSTTTGVDWEKWEAQHEPPTVYDPPQLKIDYYRTGGQVDPMWCAMLCCSLADSRSPWCRPCITACVPCCIFGTKFVDLRDTDDFFATVLREESPDTPEVVRGVFWMQDNVTAPEQIITLSDAEWRTPSSGLKPTRYNWTRDSTCWGLSFYCMPNCMTDHPEVGNVRIEISPSGKWIWMQGDQLVYIVQPHDVIRDGAGQPLDMPAGTLMRLTYNGGDPKKKLNYQYLLTRVAFKRSDDGAIVKTAAYEVLQQQLRYEPVYRCSCCGVGLCLNEDEFVTATKSLSPLQMYMPKP
mmetsp:Transcript_80493/g.204624  ORF Transcript_80493/g.204624 Transcript_80493/m.204624 type:complete len:310 (+) Transcript_80493:34-963(+)